MTQHIIGAIAGESAKPALAMGRAVLQSLEGMQKLEEAVRAVLWRIREGDVLTDAWPEVIALRAALPDPPAAAETERGDG